MESITLLTTGSRRDPARLVQQLYRWATLTRRRHLGYRSRDGGSSRGDGQESISDSTHHAMLVDQFYDMVDRYGKRDFTFRSDMLPAIAGLARTLERTEVAVAAGDRYWAGLWEKYLVEGLMWQASFHDRDGSDAEGSSSGGSNTLCVPSWSWASVFASTYMESYTLLRADRNGKSLVRDLVLPTVASDRERFIPMAPLALRFSAPFRRLSEGWRHDPDPADPPSADDAGMAAFEALLRTHLGSEFAQKHQPCAGQHFAAVQIFRSLKPVPIAVLRRPLFPPPRRPWVYFLVLESVPGRPRHYRRVGYFQLMEGIAMHSATRLLSPVLEWEGERIFETAILGRLDEKPWPEEEITLL